MTIVSVFLDQQSIDHQEIAQDANAALRSLGMARDGRHVSGALPDGAKYVQLNGGPQGGGLLVSLQQSKNDARRQRRASRWIRLHSLLPVTLKLSEGTQSLLSIHPVTS